MTTRLEEIKGRAEESSKDCPCCSSKSCPTKAIDYMDWYAGDIGELISRVEYLKEEHDTVLMRLENSYQANRKLEQRLKSAHQVIEGWYEEDREKWLNENKD